MQESSGAEFLIVHRSLRLPTHFINCITHLPLCCGARVQPIQWIVFVAGHENCLHLEVVAPQQLLLNFTVVNSLLANQAARFLRDLRHCTTSS